MPNDHPRACLAHSWPSSLSAHVGLVSADVGAIFHFERLANPLELDVAPSMVALANMC